MNRNKPDPNKHPMAHAAACIIETVDEARKRDANPTPRLFVEIEAGRIRSIFWDVETGPCEIEVVVVEYDPDIPTTPTLPPYVDLYDDLRIAEVSTEIRAAFKHAYGESASLYTKEPIPDPDLDPDKTGGET